MQCKITDPSILPRDAPGATLGPAHGTQAPGLLEILACQPEGFRVEVYITRRDAPSLGDARARLGCPLCLRTGNDGESKRAKSYLGIRIF